MKITDIFFDLDRTLWDFDLNAHTTLVELCNLNNLRVDAEDFIKCYNNHNEKLWGLYRENKISKETLRSKRFKLTLADFSINNDDLASKLGDEYVAKCPLQTALFPYTFEILKYLQKKYKLHIITNGFEEVQHIKLKASGLTPFFQKIITSEKVNVKKPDPKIFDYALNLVGAKPKNTIMIGDDLPVDIIGAKKTGIHQIYFNPNKKEHNEKIDFEISSLLEIKEIL